MTQLLQIPKQKIELFKTLANEYEEKYLLEPIGQNHLAAYEEERVRVRKYWSDIKKKKKRMAKT